MRSAGWCAYMQSELDREEREKAAYYRELEREIWEEEHATPEKCPKCGSKMFIREGKHGKFLGCSEYPYCDGVKKYIPKNKDKQSGDATLQQTSSENCPLCGNKMYLRKGKFGEFWGCSKYPACKGTRKIK